MYLYWEFLSWYPSFLSDVIHAPTLAGAYQKLAPGTHWRWVGRMGVLAGFLILSYYSVVAGWTLEFIGEAVTDNFAGKTAADYINTFNSFSSNPWRPVIWLVLFLLSTHFIIVKGVEKGIEKSAKIMMPMLFILLIILAGCSIAYLALVPVWNFISKTGMG